jgi:uncharacterized protein (DUF1501 family)
MATAQKDPVLVVVQLTGGNDYLNTVIPYNNTLYQDNRKAVGIPESQILAIDNEYGFPQYLAPMKKIWDISARWTFGTPARPKKSGPKAGSAGWSVSSTPRRRMWSPL